MRKAVDKVKLRVSFKGPAGQRLRHFGLFVEPGGLSMQMRAVTAVHLGSETAFTNTQEIIVGQGKALFRAFC